MTTALLTTKLYIPPPRPNQVSRPRLEEKLDEGLRLGHQLTLVSAPAGFGKTTLITEWVLRGTQEIAWITTDEADNDPVQFLTYLIAALQQVKGNIGRTVQQFLGAPQSPSLLSLVTSLINDISMVDAALILVLDDYHLVTAREVHEILSYLMDHQPPLMHMVVSTRQDPPLPLPRLRARSQVTELREADLRFTREEAAVFLQETMGLSLSPESVGALETRTEGWIAGLQLAALALQRNPNPAEMEAFIQGFAGDDRYVVDYLLSEVLEQQPETTQGFLRKTAVLDRLSASLCNALTGREESQAVLEGLEAANLFLIPLDNRREWYRYQHLFAEFLRSTLSLEEKAVLHRRAMAWYEDQELLNLAIRHALASAKSSSNLDDAQRLIRRAAESMIHAGAIATVDRWLSALPDERVRADHQLAIYQGWVVAVTGELRQAEAYADAAKRCLSDCPEAQDSDWGKLLVLQSFIALLHHRDYDAAIAMATDALRRLDKDLMNWRVVALWSMAEAQERTQDIRQAIGTFREAARTGRALGNLIFTVVSEMSLAKALNDHGQRREAVAVCEEAIERYLAKAEQPPATAGMIYSRLGTLYFEANQLELACQHHCRGTALTKQLGLDLDRTFSHAISAPLLNALGDTNAALSALREAHELAAYSRYVDSSWLRAYEANIHLQQGDVARARRWAEDEGLSLQDSPELLHMEQHLAFARLLLAEGKLTEAEHWLDRLEQFTGERVLYRWLLTVHILRAVAADSLGNEGTTEDYLGRAVRLAAPQDYYRAFLEEGERVTALLPTVRRVHPVFVGRLLEHAGYPSPEAIAPPVSPLKRIEQPLTEPLSERELEVLALIVEGLTNREIGDRLVIAHGTVKRHINNIYGKLGVRSRTQAVARAREIDLL